ncbi:MAG: cyanophycinase [Francisellaceae bacterium]|jgi:cyanophycinase
MPAPEINGSSRGYIIPIGGREDKLASPRVLEKFIELSGGSDSYIAVIPTASRLHDTGDLYVDLFKEMGAGEVHTMNIDSRMDASNQEHLDHLNNATGIFMTGGNQLLLSTILGGTPVAQLIRRRNACGVHVAGTSAGAAFIPEHMIASGEHGLMPRGDMVTLAPGLGLTNKIIVDQHFSQRDRLGRLLAALAYNPFATGIGIDEDTAAFLGDDGVIEVVGSGMLTIVDMSCLEYSSMGRTMPGEPVSLIGIKLHTLIEGGTFNTLTYEAVQN